MKLSIIVPVYNVQDYLTACVNSITNICDMSTTEIILINDGSTDSSPQICDEIGKSHDNIKVIHNENKGQGHARNIGLDIASGEYIYYLDSDDELSSDFYNSFIASYGDGVDFVFTNVVEEKYCVTNQITTSIIAGLSNDNNHAINISNIMINVSRLGYGIYNRKLILNSNIKFSEKRDICEDDTWLFYMLQNFDNIRIASNSFYEYKVDRVGSTVNIISGARLLPTISETLRVISDIENSSYNNKEKLYSKYADRLLDYILKYPLVKEKEIRKQLLKHYKDNFKLIKKAKTRVSKLLFTRYIIGVRLSLLFVSKARLIVAGGR